MAVFTVPSNGSDGAFNPTENVTINLSQAVTGSWDQDGAGHGVYDAGKWAVVFKYSVVNIPANVTVTFKNHSGNPPVVWLVQGDVSIAGTVDLSGQDAGLPGPGGFRGGLRGNGPGFGPGGGNYPPTDEWGVASGGYATPGIGGTPPSINYNNPTLIPLMGGSGGRGTVGHVIGSPGGGALLIVAPNIQLNGMIMANGGPSTYSAGAGGGIRLVSNVLSGSGGLSAMGGVSGQAPGGDGYIRIESNATTFQLTNIYPHYPSMSTASDTPQLWPDSSAPSVSVTSIGGVAVPIDPHASLGIGDDDVWLPATGLYNVIIKATNVPLNWKVRVRVTPVAGQNTVVDAVMQEGGTLAQSTWVAQVNISYINAAVQSRASPD